MKGRFRKGKKAFRTGRNPVLERHYVKWLFRKKAMSLQAIRLAMASVTTAMGAMQIDSIKRSKLPYELKALRIAESVISTAHGIHNAMHFGVVIENKMDRFPVGNWDVC